MENQRTVSPEEHLSRVSQGQFPEDTRVFMSDLVNGLLFGNRTLELGQSVGKYQRDQLLRQLSEMRPERSTKAKAKAILRAYQRFNGRVVAGKPQTRILERLRALEDAGYPFPGMRQIERICALGAE